MEITIKKAWGKHRGDRWGVMVEIENRGQVFNYMPTYDDIKKMLKLLKEVEVMNKDFNSKKEVGEVPKELLNGV